MNTTTRIALALIAGGGISALNGAAGAASHLWRFQEVFSNADGSIQFIEMKECCGAPNETVLGNKWVNSVLTGVQYTFPSNLPCQNCTANKHLLLATQSFADLPGAPTPDFIIPPNFFSLDNTPVRDTLKYWFYGDATWTFDIDVPADGAMSLNRSTIVSVPDFTTVNSPTNFAGETGSVIVRCTPADLIVDQTVNVDDLLALIAAWGACADAGNCPADFVPEGGNGVVNIDDLLGLIASWGPCK